MPNEVDTSPTPKEVNTAYHMIIENVSVINKVIATGDKDEDALNYLRKKVEFLEHTLTRDIWKVEHDMTAVNQAIADGNAYLGA